MLISNCLYLNQINMLGDEKPLKEIDETAGSASSDRFEEILDRVEEAGAEIVKDEEAPLYMEVGNEEVKMGMIRTVEFNLNRRDFQITRSEKSYRVVGEGRRKSLEELPRPSVEIKLKVKPEISSQWVMVDLGELF